MIERHKFFAIKNRLKKEKPMTHEEEHAFWLKTVQETDRINKKAEADGQLIMERDAKARADYDKGREINEKDNERFRGLMDRLEKFLINNNL